MTMLFLHSLYTRYVLLLSFNCHLQELLGMK